MTERRPTMSVGSTRVAPNGYHYTKVIDPGCRDADPSEPEAPFWRLTHHIKMEEYLGRRLEQNERVHFVDNSANGKLNFREDNLKIVVTGTVTIRKKLSQLYAKRTDIQKEIDYWEEKARQAREL